MKYTTGTCHSRRKFHAGKPNRFSYIAKVRERGFDAVEFEGTEDAYTDIRIGLQNLRRLSGE